MMCVKLNGIAQGHCLVISDVLTYCLIVHEICIHILTTVSDYLNHLLVDILQGA